VKECRVVLCFFSGDLMAHYYLTGGEQEALRDVVGLVLEELVHLASDLYAGLSESQQRDVDAIAQDVLHHHLRLAGDGAAEQLTQVILLWVGTKMSNSSREGGYTLEYPHCKC